MCTKFDASEVRAAYDRIRGLVYQTPLEESLYLGRDGRRYFFKLECLQTVKSFKIRGALNKLSTLTEEEKSRGIAAISSGNHGSAVSWGAKKLGIENAVVIVPETTPQVKIDRIRFYGARVMLMGSNYDEAHAMGQAYIRDRGLTYIDSCYDDVKIYGGQGTVGLEILKQNPQIDTIVVPIGGGGLITGIAVAAKSVNPSVRIIGVQTEACPAMIRSYQDHVFYDRYPVKGDSICDSLVGGVGRLAYDLLQDYADDIIAVREATIRKAVRHMILREKCIVEGGSAATLAAVMDDPERVGGKNIALVMSGGNLDGELMKQILSESDN